MQTTTNNYPQNPIDFLLQPGRNFIENIDINNPIICQKIMSINSDSMPLCQRH
ncbi:hypothetical protein [Okeania sp. SIO3B5]|uniref:hypothetical protein n=1 Tax=Okeania sp. SIO3B5 TaxID=2607811 RepID=UPI0025F0B3CC|nr:hypothetical protein [Okeania sp. SIO3B5]